MAIYKVLIRTESNTTTYTTNAIIFAIMTYCAELGKYDVSMPNGSVLADTEPEAQNIARESVTAFLSTLGIVSEWIK